MRRFAGAFRLLVQRGFIFTARKSIPLGRYTGDTIMLTGNFRPWSHRRSIALSLVLLVLTGIACAVQPSPAPEVRLTLFQQSLVRIQNKTNAPVQLQLAPGVHSTGQFSPFTLNIPPKQLQDFELSRFGLGQGRQVLEIDATLLTPSGAPLPGVHPFFYQPFLVNGGIMKPVTYSQAFLNHRRRIRGTSNDPAIDLGGGYIDHTPVSTLAFVPISLPVGVAVAPIQAPDPLVIAQIPMNQLPVDTTHTSSNCTLSCGNAIPLAKTTAIANRLPATPTGGITLSGNFSVLYPDDTYHAAWSWMIRAWQVTGNNFYFLGWDYICADGNWHIDGITPQAKIYLEYRPASRFLQLQDASGNIYAWGQNYSSGPFNTDIGAWYVDGSTGGDLPGIDTLFQSGSDEWVKFADTGMSALRDNPIEVTFPNTLSSGHCIYDTDSNGKSVPKYAWSCSQSSDGKIWLIPAHAQPFPVRHEIAHSIHSWYWNGLNGGKTHSLDKCYDNSNGIVEGFADYIAYWVQFAPDEPNPVAGYAGYNIESQPTWACTGQTNETWVSTTFWDMSDVLNDGPDPNSRYDSWVYTSPAQPVGLFLGNKVDSMSDFLKVVKSGDDSYWQGEDDKLFRLGTIIP
jgi:hypothetical protein